MTILRGDAGGGGNGAEKLEQIALARGPDTTQTAQPAEGVGRQKKDAGRAILDAESEFGDLAASEGIGAADVDLARVAFQTLEAGAGHVFFVDGITFGLAIADDGQEAKARIGQHLGEGGKDTGGPHDGELHFGELQTIDEVLVGLNVGGMGIARGQVHGDVDEAFDAPGLLGQGEQVAVGG